MTWLLLPGGLALLYLGGEALLAGAVRLALAARITPLAVGLTVVAFGTSAPELVVSVGASLTGAGDIALGNVVGSNICNVLLILGLAACIRPLTVTTRVVKLDLPLMLLGMGVMVVALLDGALTRLEAGVMVALLVGYTAFTLVLARRESGRTVAEPLPVARLSAVPSPLLVLAGLGGLALGARWFVAGAVDLARQAGMSEAVIGLTLVAVGTSLPELVASSLAAHRGLGDIAVGNVVGSNLFNALGILGVAGLMQPLQLGGVGWTDVGVMAAATVLLLPLAFSGLRISRGEGAAMLLAYAAYTAWLLAG
jgi:cation:H+ antiporter